MKGKEWRRKESEKVNISREGKYLKMRGKWRKYSIKLYLLME